jgi:hypothetical protein
VDRSKAIRFAMDETGKRPHAIKMVAGVLELDMSRPAGQPSAQLIDRNPARERWLF